MSVQVNSYFHISRTVLFKQSLVFFDALSHGSTSNLKFTFIRPKYIKICSEGPPESQWETLSEVILSVWLIVRVS